MDGRMNGRGTLTKSGGTTYEGEWVNDKMSGRGTFTWPDGTTFVGDFVDNEMMEGGILTTPDESQPSKPSENQNVTP